MHQRLDRQEKRDHRLKLYQLMIALVVLGLLVALALAIVLKPAQPEWRCVQSKTETALVYMCNMAPIIPSGPPGCGFTLMPHTTCLEWQQVQRP